MGGLLAAGLGAFIAALGAGRRPKGQRLALAGGDDLLAVLVHLGVHLPVRPVALAGVFGDEPAASEPPELPGRLRPEFLATIDHRRRTVAAE